jgi:hypothetical protein
MNQMTSYQVEAFGRPLAQVVRDIPTPQGKEDQRSLQIRG